MEELKFLRNSYLDGLLGEEEYNIKKTKIIDRMTKTTLKKKKNSPRKEVPKVPTNSSKPSVCLSTISGQTTDSQALESPKSIQTLNPRRKSVNMIKRYKERQSTDLRLDTEKLRELKEKVDIHQRTIKSARKPIIVSEFSLNEDEPEIDSIKKDELVIPTQGRTSLSGEFFKENDDIKPLKGLKQDPNRSPELGDIFKLNDVEKETSKKKPFRKNQSLVDFFETRKRAASQDTLMTYRFERKKSADVQKISSVTPTPKRFQESLFIDIPSVIAEKPKRNSTTTENSNTNSESSSTLVPEVITKLKALNVEKLDLNEKLCYYSAFGDLENIKKLFDEKKDKITINLIHTKFSRLSVLHIATIGNQTSIVKYLLSQGATTDITDALLRTPLHISCNQGFREIGILLLSKGAAVNLRDLYGNTPIHLVMKGNFFDFANDLLLHGADINMKKTNGKTVLHESMETGNIPNLKYLISLPKFSKLLYNIKDLNGETPLLRGVSKNQVEAVHCLLPHADIFCTCDSGKNLFHSAILNNSIDVIFELQSSVKLSETGMIDKADKSKNKWSPIHYAVQQNSIEGVKALEKIGCNLNVQDVDGNTPLHIAVLKELFDVAKFLYGRVKQDIKNIDGDTVDSILKRTKFVIE
eukprot:gene11598-4841_t